MPSVVHDRLLRHAVLATLLIGVPFMLGNSGSAVHYAIGYHIVFANAAFAVIEWLFVLRWSTRRWWIVLPVVIVANYVSAIAGHLAGLPIGRTLPELLGPLTIETARPRAAMTLTAVMLFGLLIEAAVFWFAVGPGDGRRKRTVKATLWANAATYPLVIIGYALVVESGLYSRLDYRIAPKVVESHPLLPRAWVYHIDEQRRTVVRCRLDGSARSVVFEGAMPAEPMLIGLPTEAGRVEILVGSSAWANEPGTQIARESLTLASTAIGRTPTTNVNPFLPRDELNDASPLETAAMRVVDGGVYALDPQERRTVRLYRAAELISASEGHSTQVPALRCGFDWPDLGAARLEAGRGSLLPGGLLVFEVGHLPEVWQFRNPGTVRNQICVLDIPNRRLGVIGFGRFPVVVVEPEPVEGPIKREAAESGK